MGIPLDPIERVYLGVPFLRYLVRLLPSWAPYLLPGRIARQIRRFRRPVREFFVSWEGWSEQEIRALFVLDARLEETEMSRLSKSPEAQDGVEFKTRAINRVWATDAPYRKIVQPANYLGIPIGFPLADSRLATFFSTLPEALCFRGRINKILLREYMSRHLPRRIVEKPKGSFVFSKDVLLRANKHAVLRKYLCDDASVRSGTTYIGQTSAAVRRYTEGKSALSGRIYALVLLRVWLGQHSTERGWL
jgi:asparagine synthase (glutamine-hydrolysing)